MTSNIKITKEKDILFLKSIANTGLITNNLISSYNINKKRLKQHIKSENIIEAKDLIIYGNNVSIYFLSGKSKADIRRKYGLGIYKTNKQQLEHDYVLAKIYSKLSYDEQNRWINETKLKTFYKDTEITDGFYISDSGLKIGVEVITNRYTKESIEGKKDFIKNNCDDYIMIHADKLIEYNIAI